MHAGYKGDRILAAYLLESHAKNGFNQTSRTKSLRRRDG